MQPVTTGTDARLADWIGKNAGLHDVEVGRRLAGGNANITRLVTAREGRFVLRHPPADTVSDKAAAGISREFAAISALTGRAPVARPVAFCSDVEVIGQPFSLTGFVDGIAISKSLPGGYGEDAVERLGLSLMETLGAIHRVDPAPLQAQGLGRPDGFAGRQVRRWLEVRAEHRVRELPLLDEIGAWLLGNLPDDREPAIIHCDFHLDNCLAARDRPGPYGGSLDHRLALVTRVCEQLRARRPDLAVGVRLSIYDTVPFAPGPDGRGRPVLEPRGWQPFGGDGSGLAPDLTEAHAVVARLRELGIGMVCVTAGSPYTNPHLQRPAYFPPSDGYAPPNDPLVDVAAMIRAAAELAHEHPDVAIVGSGYSYLQDWMAHVGQAVVAGGGASMVGLGRMVLSYPHLPADVLAGRPLDRRLLCRTFSDCTTAPRNGLISGCFPIDPFYKEHPQRVQLTQAKKDAKARLR